MTNIITVEQIHNRLRPIQQKFGNNIGITHLESPPEMSFYCSKIDGVEIYKHSMYMRNVYSFHRFRSMLMSFYQFYIPIEFFEGKVIFDKPNSDWNSSEIRHQVMTSMMIDTFFSVLDIYSVMVLSYFRNVKPTSVGFSYNKFLKPIKDFSVQIFDESNKLYRFLEDSDIKKFRNTEKHLGFTSYDIDFVESKDHKTFSWDIKRIEPLTLEDLKNESFSVLDKFLNLLNFSINEMCKYKLGYENPNDKILKINEDGTYSLYS